MTFILEIKEKLKVFYGNYSAYLIPGLKFVLALVFFLHINAMLGFMEQLDNIFIVLVLALICALLPYRMTMVVGCVLLVGHCYAVGIEVAAFCILFILILLIFYFRFASSDSLGVILSPLAFSMQVPCAVPVGFGLLSSNPASAFAAGVGALFYYFMRLVGKEATLIQGMEADELTKRLQVLLDGMVKNQAMWLTLVAFIATGIVVYVIRRLSINHAWQIGITAGGVCYLLIMIGGGFFFDVGSSPVLVVLQVVLSCMVMFIVRFFAFYVDYTRAEYMQYEDDDYYYYVKAVPKVSITRQERLVKTIREEPNIEIEPEEDKEELVSESTDNHVSSPKYADIDESNFEDSLEEKLTRSLKDL